MPKTLKRRNGLSENALSWIFAAVGLAAAIVLDTDSAPRKWHAAIMWTVVAFSAFLVLNRKKWTSLPFWCFFFPSLLLHLFGMWLIFERLLPSLLLGTLFVIPFAFVESMLLIGMFPGIERKLTKHRPKQYRQKE
jgi:hypothetical protein